ncbi:hypothetical protein [Streptomyces rugosispiralis]|uniref:Uncharacterized protein n=1 Tax=Streptomyces rugosispiralis TaxID=2967341 RepID=A0ABT1UR03_9ACTN|nr:hypothetical protein [Streptomyces rugosispiralis]MCQ8187549.1 hypothetical protein [Streptomyces rugosispiralis]
MIHDVAATFQVADEIDGPARIAEDVLIHRGRALAEDEPALLRRADAMPVGVHMHGPQDLQAVGLGLARGSQQVVGVDPPATCLVLVRRAEERHDRLGELTARGRVGGTGIAAERDALDGQCRLVRRTHEEGEARQRCFGGDAPVLTDGHLEEFIERLILYQDRTTFT